MHRKKQLKLCEKSERYSFVFLIAQKIIQMIVGSVKKNYGKNS